MSSKEQARRRFFMLAPHSLSRQHVKATWTRWRTAHPARLLHDPWPRVLAHAEGGVAAGAVEAGDTRAWLTTLAALDELSNYRDLATLTRRAVELLRAAVGLERAAVFLLDARHKLLIGTFGTGHRGQTTDERHIAFELSQSHREAFTLSCDGLAQWSRFANVPLFAQCAEKTVVLGTGENVILPIPASCGSVGLVACDWALSGRRADSQALLRAAVLARVLGPLLERSNATGEDFPCPNSNEWLAGQALRQLKLDPDRERHDLARQLGTTGNRLGSAFKAAFGESLQSYRNRLRLERFLAIVDPADGNILATALEAGFGSYAQFHRVFRQRLGCSPVHYLQRRPCRRLTIGTESK